MIEKITQHSDVRDWTQDYFRARVLEKINEIIDNINPKQTKLEPLFCCFEMRNYILVGNSMDVLASNLTLRNEYTLKCCPFCGNKLTK